MKGVYSSQSTRPVGQVLWEKIPEEVILHMLLKDKCMCSFTGQVKIVSH